MSKCHGCATMWQRQSYFCLPRAFLSLSSSVIHHEAKTGVQHCMATYTSFLGERTFGLDIRKTVAASLSMATRNSSRRKLAGKSKHKYTRNSGTEGTLGHAKKDKGRKGNKPIWAGAALMAETQPGRKARGRHGCRLQQKTKKDQLLQIQHRMQRGE